MSTYNIEYRALTSLDELQQYRQQWNRLVLRGKPRSPMLSYAWIANHLAHFEASKSWVCVLAMRDRQLVAALPLVIEESTFPGCKTARAPFGDHLNITDVLVEADIDNDVLAGLLRFAFASRSNLAYVEFQRLPETSQLSRRNMARAASLEVALIRESCGYYLPVPDDYEQYERSLSRNFRSNLKKATNKLARLGPVDFDYLDDDANVRVNLERFASIEESGWKGRSGTAIGTSDALMQFYSDVLRDLEGTGFLEWHFLRTGDTDLAGHMAFRAGNKVILWKLAYNEEYASCSPGNQLLRDLVRREGAAGACAEVDLTTDQAWYEKWNMQKRPYFHIRVYNRASLLGTLFLFRDRMRDMLRKSKSIRRLRQALEHVKMRVSGK